MTIKLPVRYDKKGQCIRHGDFGSVLVQIPQTFGGEERLTMQNGKPTNGLKPFSCKICHTEMCMTNGTFIRLEIEVRGRLQLAEIHTKEFELVCPNVRCSARRLWVARDEVKL